MLRQNLSPLPAAPLAARHQPGRNPRHRAGDADATSPQVQPGCPERQHRQSRRSRVIGGRPAPVDHMHTTTAARVLGRSRSPTYKRRLGFGDQLRIRRDRAPRRCRAAADTRVTGGIAGAGRAEIETPQVRCTGPSVGLSDSAIGRTESRARTTPSRPTRPAQIGITVSSRVAGGRRLPGFTGRGRLLRCGRGFRPRPQGGP
jgi:hypothetical protein